MNADVLLIVVLLAWMSFGMVPMGRRGRSPAAWGTLGMFFGPWRCPSCSMAPAAGDSAPSQS